MNLKLWIQYLFNRKQYIKDLERFNIPANLREGVKNEQN